MEKLKKFDKFSKDIHSILDLRYQFIKNCIDEFNYTKKDIVWSSTIAPSLIMSLILSRELEKSDKKIIYANCLVDLCHLYFALKDRVIDDQITKKNEIGKYEKTAEIFRCVYGEILNDASLQGLITENLGEFLNKFFDNLIRYAKRKVYKKDEEIQAKNIYNQLNFEKNSKNISVNELIEVHKTKFGNFFRGMGYFIFKFCNFNFKNNRAYFDLFYYIGMLAQLLDDLRDFFWQDIDIRQPNIVLALLFDKSWDFEGSKLINLIIEKKKKNYNPNNEFELNLKKMREGKISVYEFYNINFPQTYSFIEKMVQNYKNKIKICLENLEIQNITSNEIIEIYGFIISLVKKLSL